MRVKVHFVRDDLLQVRLGVDRVSLLKGSYHVAVQLR
jgi:hypothetical protein